MYNIAHVRTKFDGSDHVLTTCELHVIDVVITYRKEGTKHGGELDLGGIDSTHYTGNIYYEEVVQKAYWALEMDS